MNDNQISVHWSDLPKDELTHFWQDVDAGTQGNFLIVPVKKLTRRKLLTINMTDNDLFIIVVGCGYLCPDQCKIFANRFSGRFPPFGPFLVHTAFTDNFQGDGIRGALQFL